MAGHRPFRELTKDWPAEWRQRVKEEASALRREMELQEEQREQRGGTPSAFGTSPWKGEGDGGGVSPCEGEGGLRAASPPGRGREDRGQPPARGRGEAASASI